MGYTKCCLKHPYEQIAFKHVLGDVLQKAYSTSKDKSIKNTEATVDISGRQVPALPLEFYNKSEEIEHLKVYKG